MGLPSPCAWGMHFLPTHVGMRAAIPTKSRCPPPTPAPISTLSVAPELFCQGGWNKVSRLGGRLKQQRLVCSVMEARSPRLKCRPGWFPVRAVLSASLSHSPSFWGLLAILGIPRLTDTPSFFPHLHMAFSSVFKFPPFIRTPIILY